MLAFAPGDRICAQEALHHPYFNGHDTESSQDSGIAMSQEETPAVEQEEDVNSHSFLQANENLEESEVRGAEMPSFSLPSESSEGVGTSMKRKRSSECECSDNDDEDDDESDINVGSPDADEGNSHVEDVYPTS